MNFRFGQKWGLNYTVIPEEFLASRWDKQGHFMDYTVAGEHHPSKQQQQRKHTHTRDRD